jgi:hypothetical protein
VHEDALRELASAAALSRIFCSATAKSAGESFPSLRISSTRLSICAASPVQ